MLTLRNFFLLVVAATFLIGCIGKTYSQDSVPQGKLSNEIQMRDTDTTFEANKAQTYPSPEDIELCMGIQDGEILVSNLPAEEDAPRNSFYLECALGIFIGTVKVTDEDRNRARDAQIENAAYLLSKPINPNHITRFGDGLLSSVLDSGLSEADKMTWVERLVAEGASINRMREYGNEALGTAEYQELPEIYDWLIEKGARPKPPP